MDLGLNHAKNKKMETMEMAGRMSSLLKGAAACGNGGLKLPMLQGRTENLDFSVNTDFLMLVATLK